MLSRGLISRRCKKPQCELAGTHQVHKKNEVQVPEVPSPPHLVALL